MSEDSFWSREYITHERWAEEMRSLIQRDTLVIHMYKNMYLDLNISEKDRENYKTYIEDLCDNVLMNSNTLKTGSLEKDYTAFFLDNGLPMMISVSILDKKRIEERMRDVYRLYV